MAFLDTKTNEGSQVFVKFSSTSSTEFKHRHEFVRNVAIPDNAFFVGFLHSGVDSILDNVRVVYLDCSHKFLDENVDQRFSGVKVLAIIGWWGDESSRDGSARSIPIGFFLVTSEKTWVFELLARLLHHHAPSFSPQCLITDLACAASGGWCKIFPASAHLWCVYHTWKNMIKHLHFESKPSRLSSAEWRAVVGRVRKSMIRLAAPKDFRSASKELFDSESKKLTQILLDLGCVETAHIFFNYYLVNADKWAPYARKQVDKALNPQSFTGERTRALNQDLAESHFKVMKHHFVYTSLKSITTLIERLFSYTSFVYGNAMRQARSQTGSVTAALPPSLTAEELAKHEAALVQMKQDVLNRIQGIQHVITSRQHTAAQLAATTSSLCQLEQALGITPTSSTTAITFDSLPTTIDRTFVQKDTWEGHIAVLGTDAHKQGKRARSARQKEKEEAKNSDYAKMDWDELCTKLHGDGPTLQLDALGASYPLLWKYLNTNCSARKLKDICGVLDLKKHGGQKKLSSKVYLELESNLEASTLQQAHSVFVGVNMGSLFLLESNMDDSFVYLKGNSLTGRQMYREKKARGSQSKYFVSNLRDDILMNEFLQ